MMSTLGAMDASEATQKLTAVLNGYKLEAEDAITVVDKLVNADLIAATSTEELATAFQYSAAFAGTAGVSIDKMIAMLTTASETTRLSGETIGQAFKSIFSRLQNVKAGKNVDDEGESINDSEKTLKRYNITLRESATEFRNMEDVLDEVGRRWKEFDSVEQAQIATAISGKVYARTHGNMWETSNMVSGIALNRWRSKQLGCR